ncbi:T9SS type A sorting domain-containing protein [Phaeocystidibacter luteus]|uniref:T9SS type A sorting domain-containing protein n=1 Tax=Phaeocystidibacter luteus TaxID=911197 RepID=A0A6N6RHQ4_9FLAO|nr:T9SS type A sorting domain-containing protein [Phaeocystidibacter luteus]KAB2813842.1 T9SS type A sorting domain-containing protein [Phaeocystidibacter luteus]
MKKLYAFALLMGSSAFAMAQTYAVDFAVDLNASGADSAIIAGDFAAADASGLYTNWNDGVGNPDSAVVASDPDMDGIWTFTANLPDGSYQYKYLANAGGWESVANRTFTVSGGAVQLDTFCYDVVTPGLCPSTYADTLDVTIQIDMSTVCGFDPSAGDIVDFAGEPNGWSGDTMADPDGDLIYEVTYLDLPVQVDIASGLASFQGKCRINSDWGSSEGGANRVFEFGTDTILAVRCYGAFAYGACTPIPDPATVTFRVDMNAEVPAPDGKVFIIGDFTQWQAGALEMLDPDGDGVYEVVVPNFCPPEIYWKFTNGTPDSTGTIEESADFSDIGGCGVDNGSFSDNRYLMRPMDGNDVIVEFAFNTCNGIQGGVSVDEFSNETIFLNPNPMTDRATVELPEGTFNGHIIDLSGRVVRSIDNASNELVIERDGLNNGIYMLVLTNDKGETNTTKFVIR